MRYTKRYYCSAETKEGENFLSLIFTRELTKENNIFTEKAGVLFGDSFKEAANVSNSERNYGKVADVYDVSMSEAIIFLRKPYNTFISSLWLKRCIHAGILHGAVFEQSNDYFFSMTELDQLYKTITEKGNILRELEPTEGE